MNISCQSIINIDRPRQGILDLKNAELDRIFLPVHVSFSEPGESEKTGKLLNKNSPETITERYGPIIEKCAAYGIQIAFITTPVIPPKANSQAVLPMLETVGIQCLVLCKEAKCRFLLLELPDQLMENDGDGLQGAYDYFFNMAKMAREYQVTLLLKNKTKEAGGHLVRGFCAEASDAVEWVDRLNRKLGYDAYGFCVDTGICNICGNHIQSFIDTLGNRIKAVVLRENDGCRDMSMLPFTCAAFETDWLGVIRGLRDIGFDGELAVDFSNTYASFSPLLRPALYPLVKRTAEYFRWQIGIESALKKYRKFVLFGAGNMCRNYMKCYGKKYPPLFTCDNNPKTWGTVFEGLEVKSPEELNSLPEDCCVVICNIYYREIETQLREMGIKNIGYFNDEYMPSFYYDRLGNERDMGMEGPGTQGGR